MPAPAAMYASLAGKHVLISGGATGIGAAMVAGFAAQGARVAFLDIDADAGAALAAWCPGLVQFFSCDVTDIGALRMAITRVERHFGGGVDVLVNNAARDDRHEMRSVEPEYWRRQLAVNLDHQFFATQAISTGMAARGGGAVIMMGSVSWMCGMPGMVAYTTAKAAINGLTKTMARELGSQGIRVNCIVPGAVRTPRQDALWTKPGDHERLMERQALKFRLDPTHIARAAVFLASEEAAGMTGANMIVDAGLTQN
jgi:NAD(P)-dependent dehydrogenase (short-subunit alcohol dehydrogenase family)